MKEFEQEYECNELPDDQKLMHYNIMCKYAGERGMKQVRQMIAIEGVEVTTGRIVKSYYDQGVVLPQPMLDSIYNAVLWAHKLQQHN